LTHSFFQTLTSQYDSFHIWLILLLKR